MRNERSADEFIACEISKEYWCVWWSIRAEYGEFGYRADGCAEMMDGVKEAVAIAAQFGVQLPELRLKSGRRVV